jgi:hypothetical protein
VRECLIMGVRDLVWSLDSVELSEKKSDMPDMVTL